MKQLSFYQKLLLLSTAAASGCEANVRLAMQLVQPCLFPEVKQGFYMHTPGRHYRALTELGPTTVGAGLARLLPSLVTRFAGLLDPGATLEAALQRASLADVKFVGSVVKRHADDLSWGGSAGDWVRMLAAAAGSPTGDAVGKMDWVLGAAGHMLIVSRAPDSVAGAAAASGDMQRVLWLRRHRFPWGTAGVSKEVLSTAAFSFFQQLMADQRDKFRYLLPAKDKGWKSPAMVLAAAAAARDSAEKLAWLQGRGAGLGAEALEAAAGQGNLEAVQLLADVLGTKALQRHVFEAAIRSGSVPTVAWLRMAAGCPAGLDPYSVAIHRGDEAMLRWLLEVGWPCGAPKLDKVLCGWPPAYTSAKAQELQRVLQVCREAGWSLEGITGFSPFGSFSSQPWALRPTLWRLVYGDGREPHEGLTSSEDMDEGCVAAAEVLAQRQDSRTDFSPYQHARMAERGDRAMLECLLRLGVQPDMGALQGVVRSNVPRPIQNWLAGQLETPEVSRAALLEKAREENRKEDFDRRRIRPGMPGPDGRMMW